MVTSELLAEDDKEKQRIADVPESDIRAGYATFNALSVDKIYTQLLNDMIFTA
jgi:hypothetical protein